MKVGICGANGRVGRLLIESINHIDGLELGALYDREIPKELIFDKVVCAKDFSELLKYSDFVVDFSSPVATQSLLESALNLPKPLVIGTTGLGDTHHKLIHLFSQKGAILQATNMSAGVAVLNKLAHLVATTLKDADIEITEMHHRHKKDAPSGTALTLANTCAKARGLDLESVRISGRDGMIGERTRDEIAVMSLRGGDIVGKHSVGFYLDGEYVEIIHNATNRATFANGALKAGMWLSAQKPGIYTINDALGL